MKYRDKNGILHDFDVIKGMSAYQSAVIGGYDKSEEEFYKELSDLATNKKVEEVKEEIQEEVGQLSEEIADVNYLFNTIDIQSVNDLEFVVGDFVEVRGQISHAPNNDTNYSLPILVYRGDVITYRLQGSNGFGLINLYSSKELKMKTLIKNVLTGSGWGTPLVGEYVVDEDVAYVVFTVLNGSNYVTEISIKRASEIPTNERLDKAEKNINETKELLASYSDVLDGICNGYKYADETCTLLMTNTEGTNFYPNSTIKKTIVAFMVEDNSNLLKNFILQDNESYRGNEPLAPNQWYYNVNGLARLHFTFSGKVKNEDGYNVGGDVIIHYKYGTPAIDEDRIKDKSITKQKLADDVDLDVFSNENSLDMQTNRKVIDIYKDEYIKTLNRVVSLLPSSDTTFGFVTDLHFSSEGSNWNEDNLRTRIQRMFHTVSTFSREIPLSTFVCGGDYMQLPINDSTTKEMGINNIRNLHQWFSYVDCPHIAISGNHEYSYSGAGTGAGLTDKEITKYLRSKYVTNQIRYASDNVYYQIDDMAKVMFLYISHHNGGATVEKDVNLKNGVDVAIENNTNDYPIIAFCHFSCDWEGDRVYTLPQNVIDYIKLTKGKEIITWIGGHSHIDWFKVYNDTLVISFISACSWNTNLEKYEGTFQLYDKYPPRVQNTYNETAFSICSVDKEKGKLYVTRFGSGYDLEFNYNTTSGEIGFVSRSDN